MTNDASAGVVISDLEYGQFCEFFYSHTGIRFNDKKRYFVDKRITDRMKATGYSYFSDYFRHIRVNQKGSEIQKLVDSMTVNETYFFREIEQIDLLITELLPKICQSRPVGSIIKILSMPCSSGEETYSIAIKLLEEWPEVDKFEICIYGADIDSKMIDAAKIGLYSQRKVSKARRSILDTYFLQESEQFRVVSELRNSIEFCRVNILDRMDISRFSEIDVVLCRNMLIYFDDISRRKAADSLYSVLRPGGYLLIGMSESLGRTTSLFDVMRKNGLVFFHKKGNSR